MERILISACLLGQPVRYDGGDKKVSDRWLERWRAEGRLVPACPELLGGLGVPRPPAEIEPGGTAAAVAEGLARVMTPGGEDVTAAFLAGAEATLTAALEAGCRFALLKENSPSCGSRHIHAGAFDGRKVPGEGLAAQALRRHGLEVYSEKEIADLAHRLDR